VSAPEAFDLAIGAKGMSTGLARASEFSIPAYRLIGHFVHLDDGQFVSTGAFASTTGAVEQTFSYLEKRNEKLKDDQKPYASVMLIFAGSLLGLKDAVRQATELTVGMKAQEIYPYWVLWCSDFVERTSDVLKGLFEKAHAQAGQTGKELDRLIEASVHGVGRAFWRDIERAARIGSEPDDGPFMCVVEKVANLQEYRVNIVSDGAGILALTEILAALEDRADLRDAFLSRIDTVDIIMPAIETEKFQRCASSLVTSLADRAVPEGCWRIALHVASAATERKLTVGLYGHSILKLLSWGFRPGGSKDTAMLGELAEARKLGDDIRIETISVNAPPNTRLSQSDLSNKSNLWEKIISNAIAVRSAG
jgi:hypothetical protein